MNLYGMVGNDAVNWIDLLGWEQIKSNSVTFRFRQKGFIDDLEVFAKVHVEATETQHPKCEKAPDISAPHLITEDSKMKESFGLSAFKVGNDTILTLTLGDLKEASNVVTEVELPNLTGGPTYILKTRVVTYTVKATGTSETILAWKVLSNSADLVGVFTLTVECVECVDD